MSSINRENHRQVSLNGLSGAARPRRSTAALQVFILCLAFAALYFPVFVSLVKMWWGSDDYSHGFLVPFISFYMVWAKRGALKNIEISPNLAIGIPLVLAAGVMFTAGSLASVVRLQEISVIVMTAALLLVLLGRAYIRVLALPTAYLLFMIKILGDGPESFHWPFQLIAANIGVWFLHTSGFTVYQEAQFIQLPSMTLEVASACSGVRFLVTIVAIGIPLAHFTQRTTARKVLLVAFGVVAAIVMNGFRVALIGVWLHYGSTALVHGPFHVFQGVFVAWVGLFALFAGAFFMSRGNPGITRGAVDKAPALEEARELWQKILAGAALPRWRVAWAASVLIISGTCVYSYLHTIKPVQMRSELRDMPVKLGELVGESISPTEEKYRVDNVDEEIFRAYSKAQEGPSILYVAYFTEQARGRSLVTYRTAWRFHRGEKEVAIHTGTGRSYKVNRAILTDGPQKRVVYFWYDVDGRVVANRYITKLWLLWSALAKNSSNGAMITVSTQFYRDSELEGSEMQAQALAAAVLRNLYGKDHADI